MAGGEGCYPWLIPAGKLVSAHRAWRHTLHGGCVSGGRQWGGGGPPHLVCDRPWPWSVTHCPGTFQLLEYQMDMVGGQI